MAKSKKRRNKKPPSNQRERASPQSEAHSEEQPQQFGWIPLWGWILIFLAPLVISEFMFYMADRRASMILFPVAWIGFWVSLMQRSGWPIIKKRDKKPDEKVK
jgi:hypothetical protein